jgi:hypothetical protein
MQKKISTLKIIFIINAVIFLILIPTVEAQKALRVIDFKRLEGSIHGYYRHRRMWVITDPGGWEEFLKQTNYSSKAAGQTSQPDFTQHMIVAVLQGWKAFGMVNSTYA